MAIDARGLDQACACLHSRTARVIGWGSGSVFDYFHGLYPIRLDYLVDNDSTRWGQSRHGISIAPPERLRLEDPSNTVVVIYSSSWTEIQQQLASLGACASLPASAAFADAGTREKLTWADAIAHQPQGGRAPRSHNTIVVQGPVVEGVTTRVLSILTALHPTS